MRHSVACDAVCLAAILCTSGLAVPPSAPKVPGLGKPFMSTGRMPGAPAGLGVAAFVGRQPSASLLPDRQPIGALGLARADLAPLQMRPTPMFLGLIVFCHQS